MFGLHSSSLGLAGTKSHSEMGYSPMAGLQILQTDTCPRLSYWGTGSSLAFFNERGPLGEISPSERGIQHNTSLFLSLEQCSATEAQGGKWLYRVRLQDTKQLELKVVHLNTKFFLSVCVYQLQQCCERQNISLCLALWAHPQLDKKSFTENLE